MAISLRAFQYVIASVLIAEIACLTCWNAKCTWNAALTTRLSCTLESTALCTGTHCVSYFLTATVEAMQCLDALPILSGVNACDSHDKCICSTTIGTILCPNVTAPIISLANGGAISLISVNENLPVGSVAASFRAIYDSSLASTFSFNIQSSNPLTFTSYFSLSGLDLMVNRALDFEVMRDANEANFTVTFYAYVVTSQGLRSTTSQYVVSITDVNEPPLYCIDNLGAANQIANNTGRVIPVLSRNVPLGAPANVNNVVCVDPDKYTNSFRLISASVLSFNPPFSAVCTQTLPALNTLSNSCLLQAGIGAEFNYNSRSGYSPIMVISQAVNGFVLTTTSSLSVVYAAPGLSFNATMPSNFVYTVPTWPPSLPLEVFDFGVWINRMPYQTNLQYSYCSPTANNSLGAFFSLSAFTGRLYMTTRNIVGGSTSSICVSVTDGTSTATKTIFLTVNTNQPPVVTVSVASDTGYSVPLVALTDIKVLTVTPNVVSGTVTRYLFYISSFVFDYDAAAFRLDSTDTSASLVLRSFAMLQPGATPNNLIFVVIKVIAIGSNPSIQTVVFTNQLNITKAVTFPPYIDTSTIPKITPSLFSDNAFVAEFYVYLYRGSSVLQQNHYTTSIIAGPSVTFSRLDMFYATVNETDRPIIVQRYWNKFQIRLYSLPGTRFDFGPFMITVAVTDGAVTSSYSVLVEPVDPYMATDAALISMCWACSNCDIAFMGTAQRCAVNETFCCSRYEPGSRTSRYCSQKLDFSDMVACCQGNMCNGTPKLKLPAMFIVAILMFCSIDVHSMTSY